MQLKANKNGKLSTSWRKAFDATLDAYLGEEPAQFGLQRLKRIRQGVLRMRLLALILDDYVQLTFLWTKPPFL
jgi:hypothetical protein